MADLTIDELSIQIKTSVDDATSSINELSEALKSLQSAVSGVQGTLKKAKFSVGGVQKTVNDLNTTINKTNKSTSFLNSGLGRIIKTNLLSRLSFRAIANHVGECLDISTDYTEVLNKLNVAMGDCSEEAISFAEEVQGALGVDMVEWLDYQGTFASMFKGFKVQEDHMAIMSQQLTQLAYDYSSLYNKPVSEAFNKLNSALSGQIKGLKDYGNNVSVAMVQQTALQYGITEQVSKLDTATQAYLRYITIMNNAEYTGVFTDMNRTIDSTANQMRVMNSLITQFKRALGDVYNIVATLILPIFIRFVGVVTVLVKRFKEFLISVFGLEDIIDFGAGISSVTDGFEDTTDAVNETGKAVEKYKKSLQGFDELNVIPSQDNSGSASGTGAGSGYDFSIDDLPTYNFLEGYTSSLQKEFEALADKFEDILWYIGAIGLGIAGWKLTNFITGLEVIKNKLKNISTMKIAIGVGLSLAGLMLEIKGIIDTIKNGLSAQSLLEIIGGGGLLVAGATLIGSAFGEALLGGAIGGVIAGIPMFITGVYDAIVNGLNWMNGLLIPLGSTMAGAGIGAIITAIGGPVSMGLGALIGLCAGALTDIGILIYQKWDEIEKFFEPVSRWFDTTIIKPIKSTLSKASKWVNDNVIQPTIKFLQPIKDAWNDIKNDAIKKFEEIKNGLTDRLTIIWNKILEIKNKLQEVFSELAGAFNKYVWQPIVDKVTTFYNDKVKPLVDSITQGTKKIWDAIKQFIVDKISQKINDLKSKLTVLRDTAVTIFKGIGTIVVNFVSGAFKSVINSVLWAVESTINGFIRMLNNAIWIINKIPSVDISYVTELSIPKLANGGVPSQGQLFYANERGAELVSHIGGQSVVANNQDMLDLARDTMVDTFLKLAMKGNSTKPIQITVNTQLDKKTIAKSTVEYVNGQIKQTGVSPIKG